MKSTSYDKLFVLHGKKKMYIKNLMLKGKVGITILFEVAGRHSKLQICVILQKSVCPAKFKKSDGGNYVDCIVNHKMGTKWEHAYIYMNTYTYVHVCICMYLCVSLYNDIFVNKCLYVYIYIYIYTYTYTYICIHIYMYTYI